MRSNVFLAVICTNFQIQFVSSGLYNILSQTEVLEDVDVIGLKVDVLVESDEILAELDFVANANNYKRLVLWNDPVCDATMANWLMIDLSFNASKLYNSRFEFNQCKWLFARTSANLRNAENIKPPFQSLVYFIEKNGLESTINISEVYSASQNLPLRENVIAKLEKPEEILLYHADSIWERRKDLDGIKLRLTMVHTPPNLISKLKTFLTSAKCYSYVKKLVPNGNVNQSFGSTTEWMDVMMKKLNFSVEKMKPDIGSYGTVDENGTWNGKIARNFKVGCSKLLCFTIQEW